MQLEPDQPDRAAEVFTLSVEPLGWRIAAPADRSILQASLHAGLRLPSACRNGTCRECLCRVLDGAVRYSVEWPGLSAEEKRAGFTLPCVALPLTDLVLEVPRAVPCAVTGPAPPG